MATETTALVGSESKVQGKLEGNCIHCKVAMGSFLGIMSPDGPIHNECIPAYKRAHVERCAHCDNVLKASRTIINNVKLHPECLNDYKAKKPYVPPTKEGILSKFAIGRSFFGKKNWKERYFYISKETGLCYYESQDSKVQGKAPKGTIPMSNETRLVTRPTRMIHKEAMNPSTELLLIFHEGGKEHRLLMAAKTYQEHDDWVRVFECYLKKIDDPKDIVE
jgi:hypothetical protein